MLYLVPTPIGNLGDMTFRAVEALKSVDTIYAEDTRRTMQLLNHFGIGGRVRSYHEHNKGTAGARIISELHAGLDIALVSDAGMPCISDPGFEIVEMCIAEGIDFTVLPGATAFAVAFVGSGLGRNEFYFVGFLPKSKKHRRERLEELKSAMGVHIFYESPHALRSTLADMAEVFGERNAVVARELTKIHEEYIRGTLAELVAHFEDTEPRGEFVVLVEGAASAEAEHGENLRIDVDGRILEELQSGVSARSIAETLSAELGIRKKLIYDRVIELKTHEKKL